MVRSLVLLVTVGMCLARPATAQSYDVAVLLPLLTKDLPIAPSPAAGLRLVVRDGDGAPRAGAEVLVTPAQGWQSLPADAREAALDAIGPDPHARLVALVQRSGQRYRTGADGAVVVANDAASRVHVVVTEGVGPGAFRRGQEELELVVDFTNTVTVLVRDQFQRPAKGIEVALYRQQSIRRGHTNALGRAVLEIPAEWESREDLAVGVFEWNRGRELEEQLRFPVGTYQPGDPPIDLRLPPTGQVRFILYDADERPVARLSHVHLQSESGWFSGDRAARDKDNIVFDRVPLGLKLIVRAAVDGIAGRLEFRAVGPVRLGEMVVVEGRLGVGPPVLGLLVKGIDGQPVVSEGLGFVVVARDHHHWYYSETNAEGRVELALTKEFTKEMWEDARLYVDRRGRGGNYAGMVVLELAQIRMGLQDLGEVGLVEPPILVQGVVVDGAGKPLPGMTVTADSTVTRGVRSSGEINELSPMRGSSFRHFATTDAQGRFTLRELEPIHAPVQLRVTGSNDHVVEGRVQAGLGERGVVITAHRTGSLVAKFGGGPFHGAEMRLVMRRRGAPAGASQSARTTDGVFRHGSLPAGTYDLEFQATHMDDPLRIEGVEVPAGGAATDPRLVEIDWSSAFRLVRVRVVGPDRKPMAKKGKVHRYVYSPRGNRSGSVSNTDAVGVATFFSPMKRAEIAVKFEGYFHEIVPADKDQFTFELRPAPKVVATLAADTPIPKGLKIDFQLMFPRQGPWSGTPERPLRAGQSRTLQATAPGAQRLVLVLSSSHCRGSDGAMNQERTRAWGRYRELFSVDLHIVEGAVPVPVTVELDEAARERLVEAAQAVGLIEEEGK